MDTPHKPAALDEGRDGEAGNGAPGVPARTRPRTPSAVWAVGLLGGFVGAVCGVVLMLFVLREPPPPKLTEETLRQAEQAWASRGPASYNMLVEVTTDSVSRIRVEVRQGQCTAMTINGRPARRRAAGDYWTVPGQFDILRTELEHCANPQRAFHVQDANQVVLRAAFHPHYGYPLRCQRDTLGRGPTMRWLTTAFEVVAP